MCLQALGPGQTQGVQRLAGEPGRRKEGEPLNSTRSVAEMVAAAGVWEEGSGIRQGSPKGPRAAMSPGGCRGLARARVD